MPGFFDLETGGPDWSGWYFGPWGRARNWRVHAPDGTSYTAGEILEVRYLQRDVDYLRGKVRHMEACAGRGAVHLTVDDAAVLREAAALLERISAGYRRPRRRVTASSAAVLSSWVG